MPVCNQQREELLMPDAMMAAAPRRDDELA
jgi:hypothetical protein